MTVPKFYFWGALAQDTECFSSLSVPKPNLWGPLPESRGKLCAGSNEALGIIPSFALGWGLMI